MSASRQVSGAGSKRADRQAIAERVRAFCDRYGLTLPVLLAPMAGVPAPELSVAVANAGGMGAFGALLASRRGVEEWMAAFRDGSTGSVQLNTWIPDPPPGRDEPAEARVREFLAGWGPPVPPHQGAVPLHDFNAQCDAFLAARPTVVSSIMGVLPEAYVTRLHQAGIALFATATTLRDAKIAQEAGANAVIVQGAEAGGHRGAFKADDAEREAVGLFALLPRVADELDVPVVAAGGIGDGRSIAAALLLGASAVMMGSAFLRCPETRLAPAWADALTDLPPEGAVLTRAFSGRAGRAIATNYVNAAARPDAPAPRPYPLQRIFTAKMREYAIATGDLNRMQAWAGQSAATARPIPAAQFVQEVWADARRLLAIG